MTADNLTDDEWRIVETPRMIRDPFTRTAYLQSFTVAVNGRDFKTGEELAAWIEHRAAVLRRRASEA